jgi:hypothetical protein
VQASPLRILRSVRDIGRDVRDWNDRTAAEDEALGLLEPGVRSGESGTEDLALYTHLANRASADRVAELLAEAEHALGSGDLRRTRRTLDRALELEPGSSQADRLLDEIDERAWLAESAEDVEAASEADTAHGRVPTWEVELGTALLVDDLERARALGPADASDAAFARATASFLCGERKDALAAFARIASGDDAAAARAAEVVADSQLNPGSALEFEVANFRARRMLGLMGGTELVAAALPSTSDALLLTRDTERSWQSRDSVRAWQDTLHAWRRALRPGNLLIDAPARAWRSWQPSGRALHAAATRYLEVDPAGAQAKDALGWVESLGGQRRADSRIAAFSDGMLLLPHARTGFDRLSATRLVVAREAIASAVPELLPALGDFGASALLLELERPQPGRESREGALSREQALDALGRLASGIEGSALAPLGDHQLATLADLRRLDARVREGHTLIAEPWLSEVASSMDALGLALVDGQRSRTVGNVELQRRRETLVAERRVDGSSATCPPEVTCIELARDLDSVFYASSGVDGDVGVGARAGFENAQLSLEMGLSGPRASLVIPFSRWFGIGRFFPVDARLAVGLDGISAGPGRDEEATEPDPSLPNRR